MTYISLYLCVRMNRRYNTHRSHLLNCKVTGFIHINNAHIHMGREQTVNLPARDTYFGGEKRDERATPNGFPSLSFTHFSHSVLLSLFLSPSNGSPTRLVTLLFMHRYADTRLCALTAFRRATPSRIPRLATHSIFLDVSAAPNILHFSGRESSEFSLLFRCTAYRSSRM